MKTKKRTFGIVISVAVLVAAIITGVILKSNTNTNAAVLSLIHISEPTRPY